jgi:hypothetical protein
VVWDGHEDNKHSVIEFKRFGAWDEKTLRLTPQQCLTFWFCDSWEAVLASPFSSRNEKSTFLRLLQLMLSAQCEAGQDEDV